MKMVGILARPGLTEAGPALADLIGWLHERDVRACLDPGTADLLPNGSTPDCVVEDGRDLRETVAGEGTRVGEARDAR